MLLVSCAAAPPIRPPDPLNPVWTVAVLPVYNVTNDVEGPEVTRSIAERFIGNLHYKSVPLKEVDRILRDRMGITLGSQLPLTTAQDLGRTLGVDGVLYGYLLDYDVLTAGIYNVNRVRAGFKLVDTKTGTVIWSRGQGVKSEIVSGKAGVGVEVLEGIKDIKTGGQYKTIEGLSDIPGISNWRLMGIIPTRTIEEAGILSLGQKIVTKTFGVYLRPETNVMMRIIFSDFPAGPGASPEIVTSNTAVPEVRELPRIDVIFEFMTLNEKKFISDVSLRSFQKLKNRESVLKGMVIESGKSFMADLDLPTAGHVGPWPTKVGLLKKAEESRFYVIYPEFKRYVEEALSPAAGPDVLKEKWGEETIDGHPFEKYKAGVTGTDGVYHEWLLWAAKDLDGIIVRAEFEDKLSRETFELKNVKIGTPAKGLTFEVPPGYSKAVDFMEVINEKR